MLGPMLARVAPREVLVSEAQEGELREAVEEAGAVATPLARASFDSTAAEARVAACFKVASLDGFAAFGRAEIGALGAIIDYLELTQRGRLPLLRPPVRETAGGQMRIDAATRRNLELTRGRRRRARGVAAGGHRPDGDGRRRAAPGDAADGALDRRAADPGAAGGGGAFRGGRRRRARRCASGCAGCRTSSGRCRGWRSGAAGRGISRRCATGSAQAGRLRAVLGGEMPEVLGAAREALGGHEALAGLLDAALVAEPPLLVRDGGFVAEGFDAELDETRRLRDQGRGRDRRAAGGVRAAERGRLAEGEAQQRARLLHRDARPGMPSG